MNQRDDDAKDLNVPLMITEFGACYNTEACVREINQVLDVCEETLTGWAYWQFKQKKGTNINGAEGLQGFYDESGELQTSKVIALSRPY